MPPTFSVVIPLFNKKEFVAEALRSAFEQQPAPLEILVIDDGSTDGSAQVVESLGIPTVKLIRQSNAGVAAARNAGIEMAKGDFVCFLDADDRYLPGFLKAIIDLSRIFPGAALCGTGYRRFVSSGTVLNSSRSTIHIGPTRLNDFYREWLRSSIFCASSIAVARSAFSDRSMRFPVGEKLGEDQDLWFRLAEHFDVVFDPRPYAEYRLGVEGSATSLSALQYPLPCYARLSERLRKGLVPARFRASARQLVATHWINIARNCFMQGAFLSGWALLRDKRARARPAYLIRVASYGLLKRVTRRPE